MSSGYGLQGGVSRCYPFWQEVLACYVVNSSGEDPSQKKKCAPVLEDYHECLHHKKEIYRARHIQAEYRKAELAHPRENEPPPGAIRNLGLIDRQGETKRAEDTKNVLESVKTQ